MPVLSVFKNFFSGSKVVFQLMANVIFHVFEHLINTLLLLIRMCLSYILLVSFRLCGEENDMYGPVYIQGCSPMSKNTNLIYIRLIFFIINCVFLKSTFLLEFVSVFRCTNGIFAKF